VTYQYRLRTATISYFHKFLTTCWKRWDWGGMGCHCECAPYECKKIFWDTICSGLVRWCQTQSQAPAYGVAMMSRLLKILGLFCRISSLLQGSFAKETYNFKAPTHRSHPILVLTFCSVSILLPTSSNCMDTRPHCYLHTVCGSTVSESHSLNVVYKIYYTGAVRGHSTAVYDSKHLNTQV